MSLTNTATFTKKLITTLGIVLAASLFLLIAYNIGKGVYKSFFPDKPPPPLVAFGKLPAMQLDEGVKPPGDITYRLETVTGDLPTLVQDLKVFGVESPEAKFGDASRTDSWAQSLQYSTPAVSNFGNVATYILKEDPSQTLKIGVVNQKGEITSGYLTNIKLISEKHKGEEVAKKTADKVIKVFGLSEINYPVNKIAYAKYKIDSGRLVEVNDLASTNLIQVNYGRGDLDKIPVVYPQFGKTKVWVLTSSEKEVAAKIDATKIQEYKFSTYPLKGVKKAFEELKSGKAVFNKEPASKTFDIRDVKLAYLDTDTFQPYLQPVYMFEGNDGVAAFVPAVHDLFVKSNSD